MKAERNTLAKYAYPELKNFCRERGLEFQVSISNEELEIH